VLDVQDKMPIAGGAGRFCPAFQSATCGNKTLGVLLRGASTDGALGAAKIRERGGFVVVQNPATAECPVMPQAAIAAAASSAILPLDAISGILDELFQRQHRG